MSTWFDERVTCPSCATEQTARLARGVHVARAPEARDQVFDRTFHRVTCTACGVRFVAQRPLVYTDMDRRHWIQVALAIERPRWPELEEATGNIFERAFVGSPLAASLREGMKVRLVFGMEELREKLVIWRAGLDDGVVECVKVQAFAREPALSRAHRLLVDEVTADHLVILVEDHADQPPRASFVPRALADAAHDDYARLRRTFPELFGAPFVSTHRLLGHRYRPVEPTD